MPRRPYRSERPWSRAVPAPRRQDSGAGWRLVRRGAWLAVSLVALPALGGPAEEARGQVRLVPRVGLQLMGGVGGGEPPSFSTGALRGGVRLAGPDWIEANLEIMHDRLPLSPGHPTDGPRLREARVTLHLPQGPSLSLGALRAQLGRESLTPIFLIPSTGKALAQRPLRLHLTGRSTGVAAGLNLGDLVAVGPFWLRYDVGLVLDRPGARGEARPALLLGRAVLAFGEPEQARSQLSLSGFDPQRPGLSVGLQASVDTSAREGSVGVDLMHQGAFTFLALESHWISAEDARETLASSARGSLALPGPGTTRLEPYALLSHVWRTDARAGLQLGAGLAWWIDADRLRLSAGASSTLLASDRSGAELDRAPRGELLLQLRR